MKILHLCWGLEPTNGAANIARLVCAEQRAAGHDVALRSSCTRGEIAACDELWCHCGWYWRLWRTVAAAKRLGKRIVWMPEGCYDPVRLAYHGWKKRLAGPFERRALRRADRLVATCAAERGWIRDYVGSGCPEIEVTDVTRFFDLTGGAARPARPHDGLNVLYLGRPHPLKDRDSLVAAVEALNAGAARVGAEAPVRLRLVSDHAGAELARDWDWCDVLCLPTLSDNFGLVVAEALERGKAVVVTDGAPVWENWATRLPAGRLAYVRGYRDASAARRVELLKSALSRFGRG